LQYPWEVIPEELIKPLEDAAREGNSSLYVNGIDPGFANDLLRWPWPAPVRASSRFGVWRIVDYATYDSAAVMFDVMGFGKPMDDIPCCSARCAELGVGIGDPADGSGLGHFAGRGHPDVHPRTGARGL